MPDDSPILSLPLILPAQVQKHGAHHGGPPPSRGTRVIVRN